jgi:hypothetical protein
MAREEVCMLETNTITRTAIAVICLSSQLACAAPQLVKMDPSRSIETDDGYQQSGKTLDPEDMTEKLSQEPAAAEHVSRARTLSTISLILAAAGGALVGWPVGAKIGGQANPPWALAYAGGGAILVSIPFALWGASSMSSAVDAHNGQVESATRAP